MEPFLFYKGNNMFDTEFYPTPPELVEQMIKPYRREYLKYKTILEPSAGKGDILDIIYDEEHKVHTNHRQGLVIEKNIELVSILNSKGYTVLGFDFLEIIPTKRFDLILMNPPFSNGEDHLLHAWEISNGNDIVCILNASVIHNPYSKKRQLINDLIERYGSYELVGSAFSDAERTTQVEVVIIRLTKLEEKSMFEIQDEFSKSNSEYDFSTDENNSQIATRDLIGNMEVDYNNCIEQYLKLLKEIRKTFVMINRVAGYTPSRFGDSYVIKSMFEDDIEDGFYTFLNQFKFDVWKHTFNRLDIRKVMTDKVERKFEEFLEQNGNVEFSKSNIQNLVLQIHSNMNSILDESVEGAFDYLTKYHKDNREHWEGWKTNDAFKVKKKFILPSIVEFDKFLGKFRLRGYRNTSLDDIDRVLAYLDGSDYNNISRTSMAIDRSEVGTCESEYFTMKMYKKGTVHFMFKDDKLWERFNVKVSQLRNWLPE